MTLLKKCYWLTLFAYQQRASFLHKVATALFVTVFPFHLLVYECYPSIQEELLITWAQQPQLKHQ